MLKKEPPEAEPVATAGPGAAGPAERAVGHRLRFRHAEQGLRGLPDRIICGNGSDFTSRAFDAWAYSRDVKIDDIQPGKPVRNWYIERFTGSFSDGCLTLHWFLSLGYARRMIHRWREDYNTTRPLSYLGNSSPNEFALKYPRFVRS